MIQVWKCDHCSRTDTNEDRISTHEGICAFNPKTKHCYTCKYSYEEGYNGEHIAGCEIGADTLKGEDYGGCQHWVYEYLEKEREDKLNSLGL
jgi:hypothetical protein